MEDEPVARSAHLRYMGCLCKARGIPQDGAVTALGLYHLAELLKGRPAVNLALRECTTLVERTLACEQEHVCRELKTGVGDVCGCGAPQDLDSLDDFEGVSYLMAERAIHVGDERDGGAAHVLTNVYHGLSKGDGIVCGLHEGAAAALYVQNDGVGTRGDLLAHDARGDERNAVDGGRDVAEGVQALVRRHEVSRLADDGAAHPVDDVKESLLVDGDRKPRDRFQLVKRASGVAKPAAAHLCHRDAAGCDDGYDGERGLVADAAGGVLVDLDARDGGQVNHVSRGGHLHGERCGLARIHALIEDGHSEGGGLVVRDGALGIARYEEVDLFRRKLKSIALALDDVVHPHVCLLV